MDLRDWLCGEVGEDLVDGVCGGVVAAKLAEVVGAKKARAVETHLNGENCRVVPGLGAFWGRGAFGGWLAGVLVAFGAFGACAFAFGAGRGRVAARGVRVGVVVVPVVLGAGVVWGWFLGFGFGFAFGFAFGVVVGVVVVVVGVVVIM